MPTDFYTIEDGRAIHYHRNGKCNRCGECCGIKNTITFAVTAAVGANEAADSAEDGNWQELDWSEWEGYTLFRSQRLWWYFKITNAGGEPNVCAAWNKDTRLCSIWDDDIDEFPAICRYWPFRASDLEQFPDCGFSFVRMND